MSAPTPAEFSCSHGERCGGCTLLALSQAEQLVRKRSEVSAAFAHYSVLHHLTVKPVTPALPMLGYRTRVKLIVSSSGAIGLYERGSHSVVDIPHCRVMHPALLEVVAALREHAHASPDLLTGLDARLVHDPEGQAPGVLVTLIGSGAALSALQDLARTLLQQQRLVRGVAVRIQTLNANRLLEGELTTVAGESIVRDQMRADGPFHYATFGSFVQAHAGQAAAIAAFVVDQVDRKRSSTAVVLDAASSESRSGRSGQRQPSPAQPVPKVLELFAGAGALALELSARGLEVCAVETYAPALAAAERAAREQGFARLRTRVGEAESVVRDYVAQAERFDAVIVNPPRRGLSAALRALLPRLGAQLIVYVSCDPATLARDLSDLAQRGWRALEAQPFDMIPLSADVETVVVLQPGAAAPLPVLYEDEQLLVVDKPPHLPTTPDGEHDSSVLERLQREHGLPELTALHRLDVGTSGVCLFVKKRSAVQALSERLRAGEKHYVALVVGAIRQKGIVRVALREQGKTRPAVSRYTRIGREGSHSLVRVRPEQGRTHQVRKHLAAIGHPLLGDARYGNAASNRYFEHRHGLDRPFLHAARVVLAATPEAPELSFEAALAADLRAVQASLRAG